MNKLAWQAQSYRRPAHGQKDHKHRHENDNRNSPMFAGRYGKLYKRQYFSHTAKLFHIYSCYFQVL